MPSYRGKVREYGVGQGDDNRLRVEISGLPTEENQNRFYVLDDDKDRQHFHDCILVALANNLDIKINTPDDSRAISWVKVYPS